MCNSQLISVSLVIFSLVQCVPARVLNENKAEPDCGYESCHPTKDDYVNVHLIPHSHDDVGWVKTIDQFYYGTKSYIYRAAVKDIYDSVLKSVQKNKDRRFIYVETAFFWKWWQEQSEWQRNVLRELVDSGQIEFTGGGWSMNDEAVTNYQSIIDQMAWGLKKLNDTFGECGRPKMGWQIDPFGHSSEMASIFAQLGYDGVILGRIDYEDKDNRLENKSMELIWRGSNNLGRNTDIFTSVLYNHYDAPAGFCFDVLCTDEPLVDDIDSPEYNIDTRAQEFILYHVQDSLAGFQTKNVIVPMGRDFAYQEAESWFDSIDRLIKYVNKKEVFNNTKYHLLYSTPSCYTAAVQKESGGILSSPLKLDDFLPYGTDSHAFWTGFFTSRPTLKRYERMGNNFLQVCKQLYALTNLPPKEERKLDSLRQAMGVMQHHDAVTGTEKEQVAYDYARLMHIGITNCENIAAQALSLLTDVKKKKFETCMLTNISQCALSEKFDKFVVTVYNPLSYSINKYVRLPVFGTSYTVTDPEGNHIPTQVMPTAKAVQYIPGRKSKAALELIFRAQNIPPLGFKSFYINKQSMDSVTDEDLSLDFYYTNNQGTGFEIDPSTGLVKSIKVNDISLDVKQTFLYYNGTNGWTDFASRPSGAYIFRPDSDYPVSEVSKTARFEVYRGNIVTEVHQTFSKNVKQVVRVYEDEKYVEFDWVVGPIEIDGNYGTEFISRLSTSLKSQSTFYTDSNGRELMRRVRNFRPTWNINVSEPESANYYPVTSKILIRDEHQNLELAVLTDRSEGGSSLQDGEIELMILRNSISDDNLGVGESLMEMAYNLPIVVRGSHYVTLGHIQNTTQSEQTVSAIEHEIAMQTLLDSWTFLSVPLEDNFEDYKAAHSMQFSGLKKELPKNVHIMTLEPWGESRYLLRLEHSFERNQDPVLSQPVTINLEDIFTTFEIKSLQETTLGGNQWLEDNKRLGFKSMFQSDHLEFERHTRRLVDSYLVHLEPMQIRSFIVEIKPKL